MGFLRAGVLLARLAAFKTTSLAHFCKTARHWPPAAVLATLSLQFCRSMLVFCRNKQSGSHDDFSFRRDFC